MAINSVDLNINDDSPPYESASAGGCKGGYIDGPVHDDPTNYYIGGGTNSLPSNQVGSSITEYSTDGESNKYFNYGTVTFDYDIHVPANGCSGEYWIVFAQRANGGDVRSQIVATGGSGTASVSCINVDGSSIIIGAWILNFGAGSTSEEISIAIKNVRVGLTPDTVGVFTKDASLSLVGDGCAVARLAIKYGKGGEWVYAGSMGGNNATVKIQQIDEDTYVMVDFLLDCGNGVCGTPPEGRTTVSADSNIVPPGSTIVPNGCGQGFCARAPIHVADVWEVCSGVTLKKICTEYGTRVIKECPTIHTCEEERKCWTYMYCAEHRWQWCTRHGWWWRWHWGQWCYQCIRWGSYQRCYTVTTLNCTDKPDPNCVPASEQYCKSEKWVFDKCANGKVDVEVAPNMSVDEVASNSHYPSNWKELGVPAPSFIGPIMDTVIDIRVSGWSPELPQDPWSPSCGLCAGYMFGTPWSLPIECTQKDESVINPDDSEAPADGTPQNINGVTPQAGAI